MLQKNAPLSRGKCLTAFVLFEVKHPVHIPGLGTLTSFSAPFHELRAAYMSGGMTALTQWDSFCASLTAGRFVMVVTSAPLLTIGTNLQWSLLGRAFAWFVSH